MFCYSLDITDNFYYYNNVSHWRKILCNLNIPFTFSLLLTLPHCSSGVFSWAMASCVWQGWYWVTLLCSLHTLGYVWSGHFKTLDKNQCLCSTWKKKKKEKKRTKTNSPSISKVSPIFSRFCLMCWVIQLYIPFVLRGWLSFSWRQLPALVFLCFQLLTPF